MNIILPKRRIIGINSLLLHDDYITARRLHTEYYISRAPLWTYSTTSSSLWRVLSTV